MLLLPSGWISPDDDSPCERQRISHEAPDPATDDAVIAVLADEDASIPHPIRPWLAGHNTRG